MFFFSCPGGASGLFDLPADEDTAVGHLIEQFDLRLLALTKGASGSCLYKGDEKSVLETPRVKVVDTVGAGDAFTAALAVGLFKDLSLVEIHKGAVGLSAYVCTQDGGTPKHGNLSVFR